MSGRDRKTWGFKEGEPTRSGEGKRRGRHGYKVSHVPAGRQRARAV